MMKYARQTGRGIIINDGKILLMERWRDGLHYFSIPGGGLENDESPEQAAAREIYEELGLSVDLIRKVYEVQIRDMLHHIYLCDYKGGEARLHPDSPEAIEHASGINYYKPLWVPTEDLVKISLKYWEPLRSQLVHDLQHGFSVDTKTITA